MNTLVVDIGGTNVKLWRTGEADKVKFRSGKSLTPQRLVKSLRARLENFAFDRVSIGYPGQVVNGRPVSEPYNLADGWTEFDFTGSLGAPVRIMNDACMQALGSYEGGKMLYLGLGTSLGTTFIAEGRIVPLALGHLKFCQGQTFEQCLNRKGLAARGVRRWRKAALKAASILKPAFLADYIVFGGGNAKRLRELPDGLRLGDNQNAYFGGLRMWEDTAQVNGATIKVFPMAQEA